MAGRLGHGGRRRAAAVKVVWTRAAISDLVETRRYIAQDDPSAAVRVAKRILEAVNKLENHPEIGRVGRLDGTRELVVTRTPYVVPYRIREKRIELLRVLHGHQEWPSRR